MTPTTALPVLLQAFFTDRLMKQRRVSPHTIASYRDTFRLLLQFAHKKLRKQPARLAFDDLNASLICAFLDHIQSDRHNSARTRNLRLTAIRSFFQYAAFQEPSRCAHIQRVLAIPVKRQSRPLIDFLTYPEIQALLSAPDNTTWAGRRDRALLLLAIQTGLRLSELIGLRRCDIVLTTGAHVRCYGKGRKERCTPLTKQTVAVMKTWLKERGGCLFRPLIPRAIAVSLHQFSHAARRDGDAGAAKLPSNLTGTESRIGLAAIQHGSFLFCRNGPFPSTWPGRLVGQKTFFTEMFQFVTPVIHGRVMNAGDFCRSFDPYFSSVL